MFQAKHYTHLLDSTRPLIQLQIKEVLKPDLYNNKYTAVIEALNGHKHTGRVLVSFTKDSLENPLKIDARVLLKGSFTTIASPKNPYQFNYARYLKKQGIYHQIKSAPSEILNLRYPSHGMFGIP